MPDIPALALPFAAPARPPGAGATRWRPLDTTAIGGPPEAPLHVHAVLLHPAHGIALIDIAPRATPRAVETLRLGLEAGGLRAWPAGIVPIAYLCVAPEELGRLPHLLRAATARQLAPQHRPLGRRWMREARAALAWLERGGPPPLARRAKGRGLVLAGLVVGGFCLGLLGTGALAPQQVGGGSMVAAVEDAAAADAVADAAPAWPAGSPGVPLPLPAPPPAPAMPPRLAVLPPPPADPATLAAPSLVTRRSTAGGPIASGAPVTTVSPAPPADRQVPTILADRLPPAPPPPAVEPAPTGESAAVPSPAAVAMALPRVDPPPLPPGDAMGAPAAQPRPDPAPRAAATPPRMAAAQACGLLLARLQLGERPNDADRVLLRTTCAPRP